MEGLKQYLNNAAFLIPLVSAGGYLVAYAFEYGYLNYFGISHNFIEISVNSFVISTVALIFAVIAIAPMIDMFIDLWKAQPKTNIGKLVKIYILMLLFFVPVSLGLVVLGFSTLDKIAIYWGFITLVFLVDFIVGFSFGKGGWRKRAERGAGKTIQSDIKNKDLILLIRAAFLIVLLASIGGTCGNLYAQNLHHFSIYKNDNKQYIVVREYFDKFIMKEFVDGKVTNNILILPLKDSGLVLEIKEFKNIK